MRTPNELSIHYNKATNLMADEIFFSTPQLFRAKDHASKLPEQPHSTSIIFTANEKYFLLTAGHSVHGQDMKKIGIKLGNDFLTLGGQFACIEHNEDNNYDPTKLDIAVFDLDTATFQAIKEKYRFLDHSKLKFNHHSTSSAYYLLMGFPENLTTKHFPTKTINPKSLRLRTIGLPFEYYIENNINPKKTLSLFLDQEHIGTANTDAVTALGELGGISGCGIWEISEINSSNPQYHLVSIVTGEDERKKVLFSTKIDIVPAIIKSYFNIDIE